jgi:hypothetical protein
MFDAMSVEFKRGSPASKMPRSLSGKRLRSEKSPGASDVHHKIWVHVGDMCPDFVMCR